MRLDINKRMDTVEKQLNKFSTKNKNAIFICFFKLKPGSYRSEMLTIPNDEVKKYLKDNREDIELILGIFEGPDWLEDFIVNELGLELSIDLRGWREEE